MLKKLSIFVMVLLLCLSVCGGCKKQSDETSADDAEVKTTAEYEAEAEKEITEENMEDELNKLEESIDQDSAAP